jgi:hypothetical protein
VKKRRWGCLAFGLVWAAIFGFTNFGLALGDPVDRTATNPLAVAFWVELAVLVVGGFFFYRREMKGGEF